MKMIAIDMDGTLLNHNLQISEENTKAIREAQKSGIHVVIATGRDYTQAIGPLKEAKLTCPLICVNGAEIRLADGNRFKTIPLGVEHYQQIDRTLNELDIYYEIYTSRGTYTNNRERAIETVKDFVTSTGGTYNEMELEQFAHERFQTGEITYIEDYKDIIEQQQVEVYKMLAFAKVESDREEARSRLQHYDGIVVTSSGHDNLELTHHAAQKGLALHTFAKEHSLSLDETMAIGDNFNDLSMLQRVGVSVAMGNAVKEIQHACTYVTKTNEEDGVAYAIRTWAL